MVVLHVEAEHTEVTMHQAAQNLALATHLRRAISAFIQLNWLYLATPKNDDTPRKTIDTYILDLLLDALQVNASTVFSQSSSIGHAFAIH